MWSISGLAYCRHRIPEAVSALLLLSAFSTGVNHMNTIRVVGIDIAKSVFQVSVWMIDGSVVWNKKIFRSNLLDTIRQFESGTLIAMEACAISPFWGRTFNAMGYSVKLIPAQHVKAFVRSQKNDANDALAICETTFCPGIHVDDGTAGYQSTSKYTSTDD